LTTGRRASLLYFHHWPYSTIGARICYDGGSTFTKEMAVDGFEVVTRHLVMDRDLNAAGHLFGGAMLAWLDEATTTFVMEKTGYTDLVTVGMDDVNFRALAHRGDIVAVYCRVAKTGRSSITIDVKAFDHDAATGDKREVISCTVTCVCLKDHKPYAYFTSDAYAKWSGRTDVT